jgi:hypothetical protein
VPARSAEVEQFVADTTLLRVTLGLRPDPPLAHLPLMAREALQSSPVAATTADRRGHLTLLSKESV